MSSQEVTQAALPFRSNNILGVCEAIGEDFGFNPIFLRIPLGASVVISLKWAVVAYLALGLIVFASRLLFPRPKISRPGISRPGISRVARRIPTADNSTIEEQAAA